MRFPLNFRCLLALTMVAVLGACSYLRPSAPVSIDLPPSVLPPKVTAVGYGTLPPQEGLSQEQRRLLAIRASKLDAYRSLAETVAGLKLTSNTTISAVTVSNDSFRVYVEAYLRGARVLTVTPMPGGSYETVLELTLGGDFYRDTMTAVQGQPANQPASNATPAKAESAAVQPQRMDNFYLAK